MLSSWQREPPAMRIDELTASTPCWSDVVRLRSSEGGVDLGPAQLDIWMTNTQAATAIEDFGVIR